MEERQWHSLAPTYADGKLHFGSDDGYAYALNAETGKLIWKYSPTKGTDWILNDGHYISRWPCRVGLVVDAGIVYAAFSLMPWNKSYLCALNAETGLPEGKGTYKTTHNDLTFEGLPILTDDLLVYPQGRLAPFVFDRATGKGEEFINKKKRGYGGCFITFDAGNVSYGQGNIKWGVAEFALKNKDKMRLKFPKANKIIFNGDTAYALTNDSIYAVNKSDPKKRVWKTVLDAPSTFIMAGKTIYAGSDGAVSAVDSATGAVLWRIPLDGRVQSLAAGAASLIASTDKGRVYCLRKGAAKIAAAKKVEPRKKTVAPRITDDHLLDCWIFSKSRLKNDGSLRNETKNHLNRE